MSIFYFSEDLDFQPSHEQELSNWIQLVARKHDHQIQSVSFIFCSDAFLLEMNKEYLNHDYYTDIITFDQSESEGSLEGDIFISVERVKENAKQLDVSFTQELHRVMIHGILHLVGYGDKIPSEKEVMREKETACLSLLQIERST